jgi:hypothetical protein
MTRQLVLNSKGQVFLSHPVSENVQLGGAIKSLEVGRHILVAQHMEEGHRAGKIPEESMCGTDEVCMLSGARDILPEIGHLPNDAKIITPQYHRPRSHLVDTAHRTKGQKEGMHPL